MISSRIRQAAFLRTLWTHYRNSVLSRRARRNPAEQWHKGLDEEIQFWENWLKTKGDQWEDDYRTRLDPRGKLLNEFVARHLPTDLTHIRILDIGSGPVSVLGFPRSPDGRVIELTAADPLGSSYKQLLHKYRVDPPAWPVPVGVEELSTRFGDGMFDLVHVHNALDHSIDPLIGIEQMLRVVRPGCYVICAHEPNVADNEGYVGLHGWNFDERDGRFVIRRGLNQIDVGLYLGSRAKVSVARDSWIYASIKRC